MASVVPGASLVPAGVLISLLLISLLGFGLYYADVAERGVLEDAWRSVFIVACLGPDGQPRSYGTGWFVSEGYAVTAYHVVDDCVGLEGIRGSWRSELTVEAYSQGLDVALLRVEAGMPGGARALPISYKLSVGDEVYVVGYPLQVVAQAGSLEEASKAPRVLRASVAWVDPDGPYFSFQPATDAGNSGGPVVSLESGGVVGIVVYARKGVVANEYYALRMDALAGFLDSQGVEYEVAGDPGDAAKAAALGLGAAVMLMILLAALPMVMRR